MEITELNGKFLFSVIFSYVMYIFYLSWYFLYEAVEPPVLFELNLTINNLLSYLLFLFISSFETKLLLKQCLFESQ